MNKFDRLKQIVLRHGHHWRRRTDLDVFDLLEEAAAEPETVRRKREREESDRLMQGVPKGRARMKWPKPNGPENAPYAYPRARAQIVGPRNNHECL